MTSWLEGLRLDDAILWWWASIAPLAIQALVLVPLVALIDQLLPRKTWPQLRAAMWLLVMARLVLPPSWLTPLSLIAWLPWSSSGPALSNAVLDADRSVVILWAGAAVAIWLSGLLGFAAAAGIGSRRARQRWQRASREQATPWFAELVATGARRVGLARAPEIRCGRAIHSPFVAGVLKPTIYLPEELLEDPQRQHLEHVLLHELAHIRRRDLLAAAVCRVITALYWFHPGVWWAERRLRALREQCCDQTVARALAGEVESYRRTLLFFASRYLEDAPGGLAFLRPESLLILRLRLLEDPFERPWLRRAATAVILAALLGIGLPAARAADQTAIAVHDVIDRPPGCLQLRYLTLLRLAQEEAAAAEQAAENTIP